MLASVDLPTPAQLKRARNVRGRPGTEATVDVMLFFADNYYRLLISYLGLIRFARKNNSHFALFSNYSNDY